MKKNPLVTIEMENGGVIEVELYPDIAPNTVANFVELVQKRLLRRADLPPRDPGLYDPGRRPAGHGHGRPRLQHQGRIRAKRR